MKNVESIDRLKFLEQIYESIEDLLVDFFKKLNDIDIQIKLKNVNDEITKKNDFNQTTSDVIIYKKMFRFFTLRNALHERLHQDSLNEKCLKQLNEVAKNFARFVNHNDYSKN